MQTKIAVLALLLATVACGQSGGPPKLEKPDSIIQGVNYIGLAVDDLDAAEAYYAAGVATEVVDSSTLPAGNPLARLHPAGKAAARTRTLRRTNSQIRLIDFDEPSATGPTMRGIPVQGPGMVHLCFQVAQQTDVYRRMLAAGGAPVGKRGLVQLNERNPVYYGYVKDPKGVITEVEQVDLAKLDPPRAAENQYRIRHVSLATPDLAPMIAFYSKFLGGQEPRHVGKWMNVSGEAVDQVSGLSGSKIEMAWFQLRNLEIEIFQYHSHATQRTKRPRPLDAPGYNMIVFDVADVAQARRRVIEAGGTIVTPPGEMDGGRIIFGRDPDGNLIGLQQLPASSALSAKNFPNNGT